MKRYWLILSLIIALLLGPALAHAQTGDATPTPGGDAPIPLIHTVAEGENLTYIAEQYDVTVAELQALNNLDDEDVLYVGQSLIVPGGEGEAVATVYEVTVGDSLADVAAKFNTEVNELAAANRLIYPEYGLVVGQTVNVVSRTGSALPQPPRGVPHLAAPDETLPLIAAQYGVRPAALRAANGLAYGETVMAGQRLRVPVGDEVYRHLPGAWVEAAIRPLPIVRGQTVSIYVENAQAGAPSGEFAGQPLRFVRQGEGYAALVGLDAFTEPGTYWLTLAGAGERPWRPFQQAVPVAAGDYGVQSITIPESRSALLDPTVRQEEDAYLATFFTQYEPAQLWEGRFQLPLTNTVVTAPYGDGRSYNGGPIDIFHTGIDFAGAVGTPVYAAAAGEVIFNEAVDLRGNVVIIDHGLGVMTGYYHLSESFVQVGDRAPAGQFIAAVGNTGLSSGPHLHWDLRIMNVAVNGRQWTEQTFP
jgi:murein DD-endopeptidase MepM/ murein hydrolase activator NlpD